MGARCRRLTNAPLWQSPGIGHDFSATALARSGGQTAQGSRRAEIGVATYLGIIAPPLLLIVVALAGGITWYNSLKTTEPMVAAAGRQMIETGEKISERIGLLYDPLYAIVAIASQVPEMKAPLRDDAVLSADPVAVRRLRQRRKCSRRQRRPLSRTRSLLPARTACGPSAGYSSTMTVSRSDAATSLRRVSTLGSAPGMDRRATMISCSGVICTSSPLTTSRASR
jgi:hypothetical protein